ncbi:MAG: zinc ribbon domain-containing protein [Candidatus Geothermincolia bacterium]
MDLEGHVCQSCGIPVTEEDMVEGSERGDFCHMCMVHDEFVADRSQVKSRLADSIQKDTGKSRADAEAEAEKTMAGLKRWQ